MAPRGETRERVLRTAADLFQRQGYHGTGVNQVLAESGAPKGSLYFHFPEGKEQLAAESVALAGRTVAEALAGAVLAAPDGRAGLTALGEHFARSLLESDFAKGCPIATVALETAGASEALRAACDAAYAEWLDGLRAALRGWGVPEERVGPLAALVLSSLQGAVMLARVQRDVAVIHQVTHQLADHL
ncbi:transcriptional regulator, TetR family [Actinomadura meyerae]|jgi:TetR/AcrR family transcriptional repressor of lmrAB and yxaGH operons|uniref:Transcriptional regulator, TetR family n=1 Tax=Actinomadura meyerae TaxID=240840 RepID=A0A239EP95_9ACTN|nr:TetR/AcrR family transcriptional regulator [Actinomadura meyerae]SNS46465.1 transcriptional regulator, TetR family [Actinomadura meyerae]